MRRVNVSAVDLEHDPSRPEGFRRGKASLGPGLGAETTGATVYDLPPGQAVCPYHYELGEEEWVLVVAGRPSVRTPEGMEQLEPPDLVFFPTGPGGAHQVRNDSTEDARVLIWSTVVFPTGSVYPDSDKVGIYTRDGADDLIVEHSSAVPYFHRETP